MKMKQRNKTANKSHPSLVIHRFANELSHKIVSIHFCIQQLIQSSILKFRYLRKIDTTFSQCCQYGYEPKCRRARRRANQNFRSGNNGRNSMPDLSGATRSQYERVMEFLSVDPMGHTRKAKDLSGSKEVINAHNFSSRILARRLALVVAKQKLKLQRFRFLKCASDSIIFFIA